MTNAETKRSGLAAMVIALLPAAAAIAACGVVWIESGGAQPLEDVGGAAIAVLACGAAGALASSVLLFFAARGRRVPVLSLIVLAAAPFIAGEVGRLVIAAALEESVASGGAGMATMLVTGAVDRSTAVTYAGAMLGSALLAAVGCGLVVCALRGARSSAPRHVTGALSALGLSVVAGVVAAHAAAFREGFGAIASSDATRRPRFALALAEELAGLDAVGLGAGIALAVAVAAGGAWVVWRSDRRGRSMAGAALVAVVSIGVAGMDAAVTARTALAFAAGARSAWDEALGFEPIAFSRGAACPQPLDFIVSGDGEEGARVVVPGGASVSVHARDRRTFISSSAHIDPTDPWAPPLAVAVDRRVGASDLNGFMEGAREAGARSVCIAGTGVGLDAAERARLAELEPMLVPYATSAGGTEIDLSAVSFPALEAILEGREPVALSESARL